MLLLRWLVRWAKANVPNVRWLKKSFKKKERWQNFFKPKRWQIAVSVGLLSSKNCSLKVRQFELRSVPIGLHITYSYYRGKLPLLFILATL